MKKLLSILLLFLSVKGVCQFPVNSTNGTATTTNLTRGIAAADSGFQYRSYFLDTASANRGRIDEVPGVMIRTAPNVIWLRNSTATAWIRQANINDIINITGCYTLLNGGIVTWSGTGLTMDVTLANYIIGCRLFSSPVSQVTLAAADVTNPRIDVIAVDTNNAVVVITGTAAATPVKPQVNTSSQLELTQILVPANATTPGGITQTIVYDENLGTPDEWDATFQAANGTVNFASTSIPFHLTIDAVPSTDAEGLMLFTAAAPVSMTDYSVVKLYIYNGSSYGQADDIQISLYSSGNPVTGALSAESYGYSHAVSGSYQIVTIPMSVFITGATNDLNQFDAIGIRIYESNSVNNLHFDYIQLQGGVPTGNSPYITNIFRIPGVDSFYFTRNGINYPIKDSIGSGGGSSYTFPYSVVAPGDAIQLENDTTANPANYFYGRNSAGRRGWYPQSGIVGVNIFNSDGTLTGNRTIDASNYNLKANNIGLFDFVSKPTYYTSTSRIRAFGAFDDAVGGGIMLSSTDEEGTDSSYIHVQEQNITINSRGGNLYIPNLNYTLSTTAKKIPIIDTASGYTYWIDPALIGGGDYNLLVENLGATGTEMQRSSNDTLYIRKIVAGDFILVDTLATGEIQVSLDTASSAFQAYIASYGGGGSGDGNLARAGVYGDGVHNQWLDTTINRIAYSEGNFIYRVAITDSIDNTTYDADAQAYIDAVNATDVTLTVTEKGFINDYVIGLKADGLWSLIYDQGLPIWGTAASSAVMLKLTHTTTWVNTPTFGSTGVTGNGTTQYGNLNFTPTNAFSSQDNSHIAVYIQNAVTDVNQTDIGVVATSPSRFLRINSRASSATQTYLNDATVGASTVASSAGFTIYTRTSSTNVAAYKNGTFVNNNTSTSTGLGTLNIYILASNQDGSPGVWSTRTMSLWSVGATLNATQVGNLSTRVNQLMTDLGINVY